MNLLELKPHRNLRWEEQEDGLVVLMIPKFKNRYLVKWFTPLLAKPHIRARLDAHGSFFWQQCDGSTSVKEIAERMNSRFHEPVDEIYDRVNKFLQNLVRHEFISIDVDVPVSPERAIS